MIREKLPQAFIERMQGMLGDEFDEFMLSYDSDRRQALRINTAKLTVEEYMKISPFEFTGPVAWAEAGFYYSSADRPGRHAHHEAGLYYIQEPSAMAVAEKLMAKPGERILDLCAAPGGKTTQTAAKMKGQGLLVANEINPQRARILSQNVERLGFTNVLVTNEAPDRLAERFVGFFDKIIVDAPCSGEGMFRKDETAINEWSVENVKMCAKRQDMILDCAAAMLKPGGRLVYSTCTFAPDENEGSIERLISRSPNFEVVSMERLWPHKIEGEGHFVAVLTKNDGYEGRAEFEKPLAAKNIPADYLSFAKEFFVEPSMGSSYLMFGDNLYLMPEDMPALDKLKVVRPGLWLGTIKKNRFEPAHALALASTSIAGNLNNTVNLTSDSKELAAYLRGETLNIPGSNGWCAVTVDGYTIGLGKRVNGIVKNHYPKGLRN